MAFDPIKSLAGKTMVIDREDIDTDQIIPARFLTTTTRDGLAAGAFADWRFDASGAERNDNPFSEHVRKGADILVAGENFGCGSSREHAPWALLGFGFKAVLSTKFGDIFRNNALKNGLLAIVIDEAAYQALKAAPGARLSIDLATQTIEKDGAPFTDFAIEPFAKACLMDGVDELGALLDAAPEIAAYEAAAGKAAACKVARGVV